LPHFDPPANRSATSRSAAAAIRPHSAGQLERILALLRQLGPTGATNEEISSQRGLRLASVAARRSESVNAALAKETTRTRRTSSGRSAAVIVAREGC
jgi:hypothetical protein